MWGSMTMSNANADDVHDIDDHSSMKVITIMIDIDKVRSNLHSHQRHVVDDVGVDDTLRVLPQRIPLPPLLALFLVTRKMMIIRTKTSGLRISRGNCPGEVVRIKNSPGDYGQDGQDADDDPRPP